MTGQIFQANLLYSARTFDLERPNSTGNTRERGVFGVSQSPPQGGGPSAPRFLEFPSIFAYTS